MEAASRSARTEKRQIKFECDREKSQAAGRLNQFKVWIRGAESLKATKIAHIP